mmetsp:Transcript_32254/g.94961  ORF Transcript_32254/g.94961 Transcript_32254/m.94961 type:complete len:291 (-) Transcript_32254:1186-2058(-)
MLLVVVVGPIVVPGAAAAATMGRVGRCSSSSIGKVSVTAILRRHVGGWVVGRLLVDRVLLLVKMMTKLRGKSSVGGTAHGLHGGGVRPLAHAATCTVDGRQGPRPATSGGGVPVVVLVLMMVLPPLLLLLLLLLRRLVSADGATVETRRSPRIASPQSLLKLARRLLLEAITETADGDRLCRPETTELLLRRPTNACAPVGAGAAANDRSADTARPNRSLVGVRAGCNTNTGEKALEQGNVVGVVASGGAASSIAVEATDGHTTSASACRRHAAAAADNKTTAGCTRGFC